MTNDEWFLVCLVLGFFNIYWMWQAYKLTKENQKLQEEKKHNFVQTIMKSLMSAKRDADEMREFLKAHMARQAKLMETLDLRINRSQMDLDNLTKRGKNGQNTDHN